MSEARRGRLLALIWREFDDELADLAELHECMLNLQRHLLAHEAVEVQCCNQGISTVSLRLEARALRRSRIFEVLSVAPGPAAVPGLIGEAPPAQRDVLKTRWQLIGRRARECRDLNARNGRILATQHDLLAHVLRAADTPLVYSPPYP